MNIHQTPCLVHRELPAACQTTHTGNNGAVAKASNASKVTCNMQPHILSRTGTLAADMYRATNKNWEERGMRQKHDWEENCTHITMQWIPDQASCQKYSTLRWLILAYFPGPAKHFAAAGPGNETRLTCLAGLNHTHQQLIPKHAPNCPIV